MGIQPSKFPRSVKPVVHGLVDAFAHPSLKRGKPVVSNALVIGAGNPERVQPEIAGFEVRAEDVLLLSGEAERGIPHYRRAQCPSLTGGELGYLRNSAIALSGWIGSRKYVRSSTTASR